ncbi:hypothetical protein [Solimicrobium silvestre]|uniref:hypothetical protein n=1 Tax=Solimicrobium silvestre TaxID=2099400 RepID=UPI0013FE3C9C|nr:hypothetical protein [Solimicrobium silvestre]
MSHYAETIRRNEEKIGDTFTLRYVKPRTTTDIVTDALMVAGFRLRPNASLMRCGWW